MPRSQGSLLTKIQRRRPSVVHAHDHKAAAADVARFRIHYRQRELDCNRCVDRVTTAPQYLHTDLARHSIRRCHHAARPVRAYDAVARKRPADRRHETARHTLLRDIL